MKYRIISNKARCLNCNTIVESKHRHDWVTCICGNMFVDGGKSYLRRGARDLSQVEELSETEEISDETSSGTMAERGSV